MALAALDTTRVVEGIIGVALVLAVLVYAALEFRTWLHARRARQEEPGVAALARFVDVTLTDPTTFGGGFASARVQRRRDTVAYGYLAVAEQYIASPAGPRWCTLTVTLPGRVPFLVADNRVAWERPDVPKDAPHRAALDDPTFDPAYGVGAEEAWLIPRVLTPAARAVLLEVPVQRLMLREASLLLRTFDDVQLDDGVTTWLAKLAERFLTSTPSFVTPAHPLSDETRSAGDEPLRPGFNGPDADS